MDDTNPEKEENLITTTSIIFEDIEYNEETIELLVNNLTQEQANFFLQKAIESAFHRGAFTMVETEIISKSLRKYLA